jgi:hypothetical protein
MLFVEILKFEKRYFILNTGDGGWHTMAVRLVTGYVLQLT